MQDVIDRLHSNDIAIVRDDTSASIGKRYARSDEIGTPLAITIDVQSLEDQLVTLRDRDSMVQVRDSVERVVGATLDVVTGRCRFEELISERGFTRFEGQTVKGAPPTGDAQVEGQE